MASAPVLYLCTITQETGKLNVTIIQMKRYLERKQTKERDIAIFTADQILLSLRYAHEQALSKSSVDPPIIIIDREGKVTN
jgi:hypothetical protein